MHVVFKDVSDFTLFQRYLSRRFPAVNDRTPLVLMAVDWTPPFRLELAWSSDSLLEYCWVCLLQTDWTPFVYSVQDWTPP